MLGDGGRPGGVHQVLGGARGDRVVDGGLEAREVDHDIGLADGADLARRELDVVRLGARRGEGRDRDEVAAHVLDDVLQRVERCQHREAVVLGPADPACPAGAAGREQQRGDAEGTGGQGAWGGHEDDSH